MSFNEIDEALALHDLRRAEIAIAKAMKSASTALERADLLYRRAQARLLDARPDDALEDLQSSLSLHPEYQPQSAFQVLLADIYFARFELARVGFTDRRDANTALYYYQNIADTHPHEPVIGWVYYQIGRIKLSQNRSEEAKEYFHKTLHSPCQPENLHALAHERLGFIELFEQRAPRQAIVHLKAAEAHPMIGDPAWRIQLRIRLSRAYLEFGDYTQATETAHRALRETQSLNSIQQNVILPEAHLAIADVLMITPEQEAEAIEHYLKFLQLSERPPGIDVTWSRVYENIGHLSLGLRRYQQAINAYEKALESNPYHPWETHLYYLMARCYYRLEQFDRTLAIIDYLYTKFAAESSSITDWRILHLQGNAHFALKHYAKAAQAYRAALKLAPSNASLLATLRHYLHAAEELSTSN